jgi:serine protease Do
VRGFLGVVPTELTPDLAETYGLKSDAGVVVNEVSDDSPASRAGIRPGDIITAFDDARVRDVTAFRLRVADTPVEKRVSVALLRDGKPMNVSVTLANREVMLAQATGRPRPSPGVPEEAAPADLGMTVRALNEQEREVLPETVKGVVVTQVDPAGAAGTAGIEEGELILEAGGNEAGAPAELGAAVKAAKSSGRPLRVRVASVDWSSGRMGTRYVALKLKD